jgi:hypothetical protein
MHTKGKWEIKNKETNMKTEDELKVNLEDADLYIYTENKTIGHIYDYTNREEGIAWARRICQSVNNFDDLLKACKLGLNAMCYISDTDDKIDKEKQEEKIAFVKRIIANAEIT